MKNIIVLITIFVTSFSFTPNINDLLYQKINNYRLQNGLSPLVVSQNAKIVNDQQLKYMIETSTVPLDHSQLIETKYGHTFSTFQERIDYVYKKPYLYVGENLVGMQYKNLDESVAEKIFQLWVESPKHNEIMLSTEPTGFFINYKVSNQMIIGNSVFDNIKVIYCVLTTFK